MTAQSAAARCNCLEDATWQHQCNFAHCFIRIVAEQLTVKIAVAEPNQIGVANGGMSIGFENYAPINRSLSSQLSLHNHALGTPHARALVHPKVGKAVKHRLRDLYLTLDPVALLAEVRAAPCRTWHTVDARAGKLAAPALLPSPAFR
jgi:hypothetical protein